MTDSPTAEDYVRATATAVGVDPDLAAAYAGRLTETGDHETAVALALMAEAAPLGERAIALDDAEGQARAEARALLTRHGVPADCAPTADQLWAVLNEATPDTRAWMLTHFGDGARCFIENHDSALRYWQGEVARLRPVAGATVSYAELLANAEDAIADRDRAVQRRDEERRRAEAAESAARRPVARVWCEDTDRHTPHWHTVTAGGMVAAVECSGEPRDALTRATEARVSNA